MQHWLINPASTAPSQIVISSWSYEKVFSVSLNFLICKMEILIAAHPGPDILECEVKWALGSTAASKARGGDGIPAELFKILKDDAIKVLHSICQQIWKTQQWPQDWKRSILIPIPKKGSTKDCSNYWTIALISHANKVKWSEVKVTQSYLTLWPHGLYTPWNSPGQNTGVGSLSLLQGICTTQGSNSGCQHCRQILYQVSHKGGPILHARLQHYVNQ